MVGPGLCCHTASLGHSRLIIGTTMKSIMKWVIFPEVKDNTTEISLPTQPPDISTCFPRTHQDPLSWVQEKNTGNFIEVSKVFCVKLYQEIRNDKQRIYYIERWKYTLETKKLEKNLSNSLLCVFFNGKIICSALNFIAQIIFAHANW